jgi:peptide/nickel transport system ATP-binding protein
MSSPVSLATTDTASALDVAELRVELINGDPIVKDVSLRLGRGEILGLVGESGSGKTTTALSILGYASDGAEVRGGTVQIDGQQIPFGRAARRLRGRLVSYVPQNTGGALNPSLRIVKSIEHMIEAHRRGQAELSDAQHLLTTVGLPGDSRFARRYPHQLSGGQQQRVCIAISLAADPAVVVLDEPTTGLDVATQARILTELLRLRDEKDVSMVYVTHDLAVVSQIADRVAVMYAGRVVEQGPTNVILTSPRHPYTRGLISSIPDHVQPRVLDPMPGIAVGVGEHLTGCAFAPRCPLRVERCELEMPLLEPVGPEHHARCFEWTRTPPKADVPVRVIAPLDASPPPIVLEVHKLKAVHRSRHETVVAASDITFAVRAGECLALVGESGSGKTTIARSVAGLHPPAGGQILLHGAPLAGGAKRRSLQQRRDIQLVSQNPLDALNPRHTVEASIARSARVLRGMTGKDAEKDVVRLLECVRLPARLSTRYPLELSGGERQRVVIARALAADPQMLVCDEVTSALDVSVQAAVLTLLTELRRDLGLSLLFITHDLGVVATVADRVVVLENGLICEAGTVLEILNHPSNPYTQRLLESAPSIAQPEASPLAAMPSDAPPAPARPR